MDIIKRVRTYVGMSQQDFADSMSVSFATVNRWENGHSEPNKIAQERICDFCVLHDVPINDFLMERIAAAAKEIKLEKDRIILYHGSKSGINGNIAPLSRDRCDFGKGFYMGTDPLQPLTLICDFTKSKFYIVSLKTTDLKTLEVPADIEWAMLVAYHRGKMDRIQGTEFYAKYATMASECDVIVGSIANDRMFYVIDSFFMGNITDKALVHSLSALQLGRQYVTVTQKACDAIRVEEELKISWIERKYLQQASEKNREKGVSLANEICKTYRREGKYLDEILDEVM